MPKVFSWNGFRFHFYSDEGHPREPKRNSVGRDELDEDISVAGLIAGRGDQTRLRKVAA